MEKYGLHDRQRRLLYLLNCEHGIITGKDLAAKLAVSERTLRNDVGLINEKMASYGLEIFATRGKGYYLKIGNRKVLHELFSDRNTMQTKEDRVKYLILTLVRASGWCDLLELEDDMFVSHTTLENDVREMKKRITYNEPYLAVLREGNNIKLEDDEVKQRNIMVRLYSENWDYDSRDGIILSDKEMNPQALDQLRKVWKSVLRKNHVELDDFGLIYIIMASAVAHVRLLEGHRLEGETVPCGPEGIHGKKIKQSVNMFWNRMAPEWNIEVSQWEHWWLEDILRQLIILNFSSENKEAFVRMIDPCCKKYADMLVKEINEKYCVNFEGDPLFASDILLHVQALMNSMVSVQTQSKYVIEELRLKFPLIGDIAHYFCCRLETLSGISMGMDDEDYIFPMLVTAWKRIARKKTKDSITAVLVSHLNYGLSYGLLDEIRTRFGDRMLVEGPMPIYDRKRIDKVRPSLIITTAKMDVFRKYDIPVITVSALMEENEYKAIEQCIFQLVQLKMFPDPPRGVRYFRHKKLELNVERRMEFSGILSLIEENLRSSLFVNELLTINWEQCYYTLLHTECLFVYMIGTHGQDTVMSSVECRYPTVWKQNRNICKIIFMIISESEQCYLGSFYRLMMEDIT